MTLPAPQLPRAPQLHIAARPAAPSRASASNRCPPRNSQPHLGCILLRVLQLPSPFYFIFVFLYSGLRQTAIFSTIIPRTCLFICLLLKISTILDSNVLLEIFRLLIQYSFSNQNCAEIEADGLLAFIFHQIDMSLETL